MSTLIPLWSNTGTQELVGHETVGWHQLSACIFAPNGDLDVILCRTGYRKQILECIEIGEKSEVHICIGSECSVFQYIQYSGAGKNVALDQYVSGAYLVRIIDKNGDSLRGSHSVNWSIGNGTG
ncbi:hypothetical protein ACFVQB_25145 [Paenibacillus sp. NPDC057886]|uniref:hypothetical protein n=1 Tax=Paenibacillus sp. NPDC057886 TaxID=3346270 RepID=UPI0036905C9E